MTAFKLNLNMFSVSDGIVEDHILGAQSWHRVKI